MKFLRNAVLILSLCVLPARASCENEFFYVSCGAIGGSCGVIIATSNGTAWSTWWQELGACSFSLCGGDSVYRYFVVEYHCGDDTFFIYGTVCC